MSQESKDCLKIDPKTEIIAVDDEKPITDFFESVLSEEGHKVQVTNDPLLASKAVRQLHESEPTAPINCIFILDVFMPEMDGMELGKIILRYYPKARLIMCTAAKLDEEIKNFIASNGCDYLSKPFNIDDLFTKIENNKKLL